MRWALSSPKPLGLFMEPCRLRRARTFTTVAAGGCRAQNLVEKIVQRHSVGLAPGHSVQSGDFVYIRPAHVMTHDNTMAVLRKFQSLGFERVADERQLVFTLDHNVQDRSEKNLARYATIEMFARSQGIDFYPAGRGIGHQVMCEEGYVQPSRLVVASDSHSNLYGALGALGTPVVRTDAAALWALGKTWWQVPPVARVWLEGRPRVGVTGKDIILGLCGLLNSDEVLNHAVEFAGPGVAHLSMEERMTIANMTTEWGALSGVFPVDDTTVAWLARRAEILRRRYASAVPERVKECERVVEEASSARGRVTADGDAVYAREIRLDLGRLCPYVVGPNEIKRLEPVHVIEQRRVKVNKAYIVSCVNSRVSDLEAAAAVLRGRKVAAGVQLYIAAASSEVEEESRKRGDWQALVDAGAMELPSGCGPCVGLGRGLLQDGEVAISATNRNFRGRMGSRHSQAFLASPAVVAQSAALGYIAGPESEAFARASEVPLFSVETGREGQRAGGAEPDESEQLQGTQEARECNIVQGFPTRLHGELLLCHADNIDTDGIYAGRHCYEELDAERQARVAMENYDPSFAGKVRRGDVLVTGSNFGCGSSREQAATALKACGVTVVLAASANETYRRNALNNGLVLIEAPGLVRDVKRWAARGDRDAASLLPTLRTGTKATIDFTKSVVTVEGAGIEKVYGFTPVGTVAQEIIVEGGLEGWVLQKREAELWNGGSQNGQQAAL